MMIRIIYNDGKFDMVKHTSLGLLLEDNSISSFERNSGWVVVGRDPIRASGGSNYQGRERRAA